MIPITARARRMRKIRPDLLFVALQRSQSMRKKILPFPEKGKPSSASVAGAFEEIKGNVQSGNAG
jgi:hypothetical protein